MAFSNKLSDPPWAPVGSRVETAAADPTEAERHDTELERSPKPTAFDAYQYISDQYQRPHIPEGAPTTVAHVASFEPTAFAFALKIGRLSGREAEPLLHFVEDLRIAIEDARDAMKRLSDPACRRGAESKTAKVTLSSEITARGNLKIRLQIDASENGDFRYDPRLRGVVRQDPDLLSMVRDVGDLTGTHALKFGQRSTFYGPFRADLSELILATHKTIYDIVDERFERTNRAEPFIRGSKDRPLLGIEYSERLALVTRSATMLKDAEVAAHAISAFIATFPQISPEKFVVLHRCMKRGGFGAKEAGEKFASLGVLPNAKPGSQAGFKVGGRRYLIPPDDIDTAAGVVERALDLVQPGWADGIDFHAVWCDTFLNPTSRHVEAEETDGQASPPTNPSGR